MEPSLVGHGDNVSGAGHGRIPWYTGGAVACGYLAKLTESSIAKDAPMRLENQFNVAAPADNVWTLLNDVPRIIPCMPGAQLSDVLGADAWKATVHVKIGPIALQFRAEISREASDDGQKRVVLNAKAQEAHGRGAAQAAIESQLVEKDGETEVSIVTDLALQGTVAQYGRGIVADVASQMTQQFADNIAELLATQSVLGASAPTATPAALASTADVKPIGGIRLGLKVLGHRFLCVLTALPRAIRRMAAR